MRFAALVAAVFLTLAPRTCAADTEAAVKKYLESINGENGVRVTVVNDNSVSKTFSKHTFAAVLYPQFPVGRPAPEGLKSANVLAVSADGKVVLLTDAKQLEKFFVEQAPKADEKIGEVILKAWLRLTQDLAQDGFYKFKESNTDIGPASNDGKLSVTGDVPVDPAGGNKGELSASIAFEKGKIVKIEHRVSLIPGPRPRCQATKLLDPDPIVRLMAEDSIRVMGSACKYYLDEQRAKAAPELQKAIDRIWQRIIDEGR